MDTYETLNKSSSFDSIGKFGILTGLKNEPCNLDKDEIQSTKPLKYFTKNFFDKTVVQNRGIFFQDGFGVPAGEIDTNTQTRFGVMTNNNLIQNMPGLPLPTTASYSKGQGPVHIEDYLRPSTHRELKACNPTDNQFYKRHFTIFDGMPITPNSCVDNVVQNGSGFRQGVDTRHNNKTKYKRN